ncbi:MAG: 3-oxoacyl-ACP synthase III [Myxococcales bacterium]|nr:3-oxoacyl-ACP synthase III [Myxococcales bacterium]
MNFENVSIASVRHLDAPQRITSAELDAQLKPTMERLGVKPGMLEGLAGITARRFWNPGVQPSEVASEAAELAIEEAGIDRDRLGILINSSVCRDYIEPSTACLVHGNLGLSNHCMNFDVGNACIAFVNGMDVVGNMIELGQIEYGIVVNGESSRYVVERTVERLQDESVDQQTFRDEFAALTLGSGAVAMVLAHRDRAPDAPRYLGGIMLAATEHNRLCLGQVDQMKTDTRRLLLAGLEVSSRAWDLGKELLGWSNDDVAEFALHQVSQVHTTQLLMTLGIEPEKAYLIYPEFGNIGPAGVPTVLSKARDEGRMQKGNRVVLAAIGSGINCAAAGVIW